MSTVSPGELTKLLNFASKDPNPTSLSAVIDGALKELRAIASGRMSGERANHTLCATALINEVFPKLFPAGRNWRDRKEFFKYASVAMRTTLISYARIRRATRRGGSRDGATDDGGQKVKPIQFHVSDIEAVAVQSVEADPNLTLDIDEAISRLPEDQVEIVRLRHYGGLEIAEVAEALDVCESTVDRAWRAAKARLSRDLVGWRDSRADSVV